MLYVLIFCIFCRFFCLLMYNKNLLSPPPPPPNKNKNPLGGNFASGAVWHTIAFKSKFQHMIIEHFTFLAKTD